MAIRTGERTLRYGGGWARVGPWRGHAHVAHLVLGTGAPTTGRALDECLERLRRCGYTSVVTNALPEHDAERVGAAGFEVRERLHLLEHRLHHLPNESPSSLRRARRRDHADVLDVDSRSFVDDWRLDPPGLAEALRATPWTRFRVHDLDQKVVAYGITGRAGRQGYLQRVAVDPAARWRGLGTALVLDALVWLARSGAERAWVNTQLDNSAAMALYERCGFRRVRAGLRVLGRQL